MVWFFRNLPRRKIVDQITGPSGAVFPRIFSRFGKRITNIVYMGWVEPLPQTTRRNEPPTEILTGTRSRWTSPRADILRFQRPLGLTRQIPSYCR